MDIITSVNEFIINYKKTISDFSIIDDEDPITPAKLSSILELLTAFSDEIINSFSKHKKHFSNYHKKNKSALNKYNEEIEKLNESLKKSLVIITDNHIKSCQILGSKIEEYAKNTSYNIEQLQLDYELYKTISEQNKQIVINDFNDAKKRYDYQKEKINESYVEAVTQNNKDLEEIKEKIKTNYEHETTEYENDTKSLLDKYTKLINDKTTELESLLSILDNEHKQIKERYRQESASLNSSLKKIIDQKNAKIDDAKLQYNTAINSINIEKDNHKQNLLTKSQALLKEFVTKINNIDESTVTLKKEYEDKYLEIERQYYSIVFKKTKEFHSFLEGIYSSTTYNKEDRYTENIIKLRNKQYISEINRIKADTKQKLHTLTKNYTIEIQNNRNNKNYLEIDKSFSMKKIDCEEQFINKYLQEKDNIYENDYNFLVASTNNKFAQKANLLKCQSQIRTLLLERNHDVLEANYYKEIETLNNKINLYNLEINLTTNLHNLISDYQNQSFKNLLHKEEVTNLLKIEKHKLLKEFNYALYDYNLKNISLSMDYSIQKIDIENQREEKIKDLEIEYNKLILQKNNISTSFSIKKEELSEEFSKTKTKIIYNYNIKNAKENYISKLRTNDLTYLNIIFESYTRFFNNFSKTWTELIIIILKDIVITDSNYSFLHKFINYFYKEFINLYKSILNNLENEIENFTKEKTNYIYNFNFKSPLSSLKANHLNDQTNIKNTKAELLDKQDSYNKTIENFKNKIYNIINDNELIYANKKSKRKLDDYSNKIIKENELKIKDYREKIENYTNMIKLLEEDIKNLNIKLKSNINSYKKDKEKIKNLELNKTKIYFDFKRNISSSKEKISNNLSHTITKTIRSDKSCFAFKKSLLYLQKAFNKITNNSILLLKKDYSSFDSANILEKEYNIMLINKEYSKEIKMYTTQLEKSNQQFKFDFSNNINNQQILINRQLALIEKNRDYYKYKIKMTNDNYSLQCKNLEEIKTIRTNKFYDDYYAVKDNNQKILEHHKKIQNKNEMDLKLTTEKIIKQNSLSRNEANLKLKTSLKNKKDEIDHLPIAYKFNTKLLNAETKKKNEILQNELKLAKTNYINERKRLDKVIVNYKNQFADAEKELEYEQIESITNEERNNKITTRHALKSIKIEL